MLQKFSQVFWHRLGYVLCSIYFITCHRFRAWGQHNVPWKGPLLIISNHASFLDPPLVGVAIGRRSTFMARKTLFTNKFFGFLIRKLGAFTVDQDGSGIDGIKSALKLLEAGEGVVVFPEGTRTEDGKMVDFQAGIGLLIKKAKVPVLPVGLDGAFDAFPLGASKPTLSPLWRKPNPAMITSVIGQVISPEELLKMDTRSMVKFLHTKVAELQEQAKAKRQLLLGGAK